MFLSREEVCFFWEVLDVEDFVSVSQIIMVIIQTAETFALISKERFDPIERKTPQRRNGLLRMSPVYHVDVNRVSSAYFTDERGYTRNKSNPEVGDEDRNECE